MTAALLGATAIGLALGLLGAGGSILTVPVLVYGLGMPEKTAIASSLLIVGAIALFGALLEARHGRVVTRCIGAFGVPGIIGAAIGGTVAGYVPAAAQMITFAVVLLLAALTMRRPETSAPPGPVCGPLWQVATAGTIVGVVTGLIGVGGGFLLVPALLRFARIELRAAMATSLALIALNCGVGLAAQWWSGAVSTVPLDRVAVFVTVGGAGMLAGRYGGSRLPRRALRQGFTWLLGAIGVFVLVHTAMTP